MGSASSGGLLVAASLLAAATVFQVIGLLRYLDRLPGDAVGIWLYAATIVVLLMAATRLFVAWRSGRRKV
jgi:uncharacterized membrane protein YhhN